MIININQSNYGYSSHPIATFIHQSATRMKFIHQSKNEPLTHADDIFK